MIKDFIGFIYERKLIARIFLIGCWLLRFKWPLQSFIMTNLWDQKSVLDLGCGPHSFVPILPKQINILGVEKNKAACRTARYSKRHSFVVCSDVLSLDFPDESFDAVVLFDVIEHLTKHDGYQLIAKMKRWAKNKVLIKTPDGFLEQHGDHDHPEMEHISAWYPYDFKRRGFKYFKIDGNIFAKWERV